MLLVWENNHIFPLKTLISESPLVSYSPGNLKEKLLSHLFVHCGFCHLENPFPLRSLEALEKSWKMKSNEVSAIKLTSQKGIC